MGGSPWVEEPETRRRARSTGSIRDLFEDQISLKTRRAAERPTPGGCRASVLNLQKHRGCSWKMSLPPIPLCGDDARDVFSPEKVSRESLGVAQVLDL